MTERDIIRSLFNYYSTYRYRINNVFVFGWESDFLCVAQSGYINEVEVKISRSDFFADFKKDKHKLFAGRGEWIDDRGIRRYGTYPNRFFYAVPAGLVTVEEVPKYAGLIEIEGIKFVKNAPLLHKTKIDLEYILCKKFYHKWLDSQHKLRSINIAIDKYRNSLFGEKIMDSLNYWN